MKSNYISLLHMCENCTITFTPFISLLFISLLSNTFTDVGTVTVRDSRNGCSVTVY